MLVRKTVIRFVIAASMSAVLQSAPSFAEVDIFFSVAPPPIRYEVVPEPRRGYTWAPGYWDGKNNKHAWKKGHWERDRSGQMYVQPRWVERNNGWALERGRWNRNDRDGDGAPNNRDRQPDNPNRR